MKKITEILNQIFAPRVTKTFYYNNKNVDKLPKGIEKEMEEAFEKMSKAFEKLWEE